MVKIGIAGICGKMGMRIADLAVKDAQIHLAAGIEREDHPMLGKDVSGVKVTSDLGAAGGIDCLIDFTLPEPTMEHVGRCAELGINMVIGTTGIDKEGERVISEASKKIAIVFSPNMAIGVNLLFNIVREAARTLGRDFSIRIDETHHVHKKDAPSGTAKKIASVIKEACGKDVPIDSYRRDEVIGNHGVIFDGIFESLEIRHDAKSRDVFAAGSLEGAKFLLGKKNGLFSMADVLGFK